MAKKELRFGIVGLGMMGRAHSMALMNINKFFPEINIKPILGTCCDVKGAKEFAEQFGWEKYTDNWMDIINDPEIDCVNICVPGMLHAKIAIAAANAGKHVFCEKPMARSYKETMDMLTAAEANGIKTMVNFNYRRVPAVQLAKKIIDEGKLGEIVSYKGFYQNDWGLWGMPMCWKYKSELDGEGPQQNGIHILDMAYMLLGEIDEVVGQCRTMITERPNADGVMDPVTNTDNDMWLAKFKNGVQGVFETTRVHAGHFNQNWFEVNGTKGSVKFELESLNELKVYFEEENETKGWKTILVTEKTHPYIKYWWPAGHLLGWEHTVEHQFYEFLKGIDNDYQPVPGFKDAVVSQRVLEAVVKSEKEGRWVKVDEITC